MNERKWSVYKHTCPNGKVYIGTTSKLPRVRWNYGFGYRNSNFYRPIQEFGWNNISHEIMVTDLTENQAYELEEKFIAEYKATDPQFGYNLAKGRGSTGVVITNDTRKRLIDSHVGKNNPHTAEWNEKISKANRGKSKPHLGVTRSDLCKQKMSKTKSVAVEQYDKNGVFIKEYSSMKEAEKITGIANQGISLCCKGKLKSSGGYYWKYKDIKKGEQII